MGNLWTARLCQPEQIKHLEEVLHTGDLAACIAIDIHSPSSPVSNQHYTHTHIMID